MTITEYEPTDQRSEAMAPSVYERLPQGILANGPTSGDHKVIGRLWILAALLAGAFVLVADILVRIERLDSANVGLFTSATTYEQWYSLSRVGFVFLFIVPLLIGIATVIVPLQLGARSLAFPRASSAALSGWIVSAVMLAVSWAIDGGLVDRASTKVNAPTQLSMLAFAGLALSLIVASAVIVTTIFTERSEGMSLYNVPIFSWSMLVACGIWLLSFPVLVANLVVMWVDARGSAFHSFGGRDLFSQVSWAVDQPQVFAYAIPVLGILCETVPVAFRRRLANYDLAMTGIAGFGAMTFGAYAQSYFNPSANTTWLYVVVSAGLVLPLMAVIGSIGRTAMAAKHRPTLSPHLLLAAASAFVLVEAAVLAAIRVTDSLLAPIVGFTHSVIDFLGADLGFLERFEGWLRSTFDEVAGSSLAGAMVELAVVSVVLAAASAVYYWASKIWGCPLRPTFGPVIAALMVVGALLAGFSDAASGFMDQPAFASAIEQRDAVGLLNLVSVVGAVMVFGGFAALLFVVATALFSSGPDGSEDQSEASPNPWGGHTLEWLTQTPPPVGNFGGPYKVTSEAPLLDEDFVDPYTARQ